MIYIINESADETHIENPKLKFEMFMRERHPELTIEYRFGDDVTMESGLYDDNGEQVAENYWDDFCNETIISAASALGRMGGRSTSDAKRAASRANGKKGGRPKKSLDK